MISSTIATGTTNACALHSKARRVEDRHRERDAQRERGAPARLRAQRDLAPELLREALHDVHPEPAAARLRGLVARREPRQSQELEQGRVRPGHLSPRPPRHRLAIDAAPVVRHAELNLRVRPLEARDREHPLLGLARPPPLLRGLDAVIDGVPDEVHDGGEDPLRDRFIELGPPGVDLKPHRLPCRRPEARAR
jgi:hypothetical protein